MPHLLTEAATWLGYAGFRIHLTCKELYEQRDEGPRMMRLELRESEVSPSYPGPPGRYPTTVKSIANDFNNFTMLFDRKNICLN